MTRLERNSPCKVNLLLNILGKRPDGFHELETLMHPIALYDTLTFERTPSGIELTCNHPELPVDARNLVWRAAERFLKEAGPQNAGVRIRLEKRLPLAAGIGGGSANAAITLLALNELLEHPLDLERLTWLAAALGSDVPFFLQPLPALATGRGEQITPLDWFPALRNAFILLIHPGFGVSTAWAYGALSAFPEAREGRPGRGLELVTALRKSSLQTAAPLLYNSLEAPVVRKYPILQLYQEFLREHGALATLMSGSGSSTFALVESQPAAQKLKENFLGQFGETCWTAIAPMTPS